jgi:hypothetical protein
MADTYISSAEPDTTFGNSTAIIVGATDVLSDDYFDTLIYGLWKFDLSQISKGMVITDIVWVFPKYEYSGYKSDEITAVYISGEWDENTTTFNNAPLSYSESAIETSAEEVEAPLPITIHFTDYGLKVMRSIVKGETPNYGLALGIWVNSNPSKKHSIFTSYSKEYWTGEDTCYLEITWVEETKK